VPEAGEARILAFDSRIWACHARQAERLLDDGERRRAARFRFDRDREAYVLAHALWRVALGSCLDVGAADVPLASTSSGQPSLPGTGLATSLSHSGSWTAIAVAGAVTLGVDIERSASRMALGDLLSTICTPAEAANLEQLSGVTREQALLVLWTRKEALLKAFGVGLAEAPATLPAEPGVSVAPPASASALPPCRVRDLELPAGLVGALAAPAGVTRCRVHLPAAARGQAGASMGSAAPIAGHMGGVLFPRAAFSRSGA
jgi:4'-phosphopantetheinyl transferase